MLAPLILYILPRNSVLLFAFDILRVWLLQLVMYLLRLYYLTNLF